MSLRIYNTISGKKEDFTPIEPGKVSMYACGVTVYDLCHIGHARSAVVFDVIYRYLKYACYEVTYVRNFTDVDDKIINRANERGISSAVLAQEFIAAFYVDMDAIGVARPDIEPRATDHIPEMIAHIRLLIDKGVAYEVEGDVYFSVADFPPYGQLSGRNLDDQLDGARVDVDERKRAPMDFALWKASKPHEPAWTSPWGDGRPGWHIECSAMSSKYLGETFDIHGGGKDLVFPHHENEKAQSEAATGKPFVNYWVHNGFVNINQEKMSKSLDNFFTIRDVLKTVHPEVLRLFLLSHHYRSPVDYSDASLYDARASMDRLYGVLARIDEVLDNEEVPPALEVELLDEPAREIHEAVLQMFDNFEKAMNDDFNTAGALGHMHKCANQVGGYLHDLKAPNTGARALLAYVKESFGKLGAVLGLLAHPAAEYFAEQKAGAISTLDIDETEIEELIAERLQARKDKNWARADEIRDQLAEQKIILKDGPAGTTWEVAAE